MYHSETLPHKKKRVLDSLIDPHDAVRITVATSALGCGVDAKDVTNVIHFGPAYSLVDYCQQVGRAGRSHQVPPPQAHAILYDYSGQRPDIGEDMKEYLKSTSCLRVRLYSDFSAVEVKPHSKLHLCCSYCAKLCQCKSCELFLYEESHENGTSAEKIAVREVSEIQEVNMREKLSLLHESIVDNFVSFSPAKLVSGLTDQTVDEIIDNLAFINSIDTLQSLTTVVDFSLSVKVISLLCEFFKDFEFLDALYSSEELEYNMAFSDSEHELSDNSDIEPDSD
ncbi:uncharacterized protein [Clytia hemisphaerica]|uniref:uncharacterized protein n=1 Tax=Clytia hemisphaerica TaxID=252671 RepID=UPI0034D41E2D